MQNNRWLQALIILLVIIASAWLFGQVWSLLIQFSNIILLFFLAWLLAFILRPTARWLTGRGLPYLAAVGVVYMVLAVMFAVAGILLVPVITRQIEELIRNYPVYLDQFSGLVEDGERSLRSWGVRDVDVTEFYRDLAAQVQAVVPGVLQNTLAILQSVATLMLQLILVFLLSFYFMKDGDKISQGILQMLPPRWQDEARLVALSFEKSFGGFIRGQLVFALVYGVLTSLVMFSPPFQLEFVLIASIVAGLCMIIPLIGNFLAFIPPMLVCIVTPDKAALWPWLLLVLFIMQSIMMNFLGPRIMSAAIGIHPLYVVGAMLIGGQVAGFWGALFGIPIAGAVNLVGRPIMRRMRHQMPVYQEARFPRVSTSAFVTGPLASQLAGGQGSGQPGEQMTDEMPAVTAIAEQPERPTEPHLVMDYDFEDDAPMRPTLSARAWKMVVVIGSRAVTWAWTRAQARAPRQ